MSVYDPYASDGAAGMAAAGRKKPSTAWMLTVADLFSLILTFFVLLYSMSVIQREEWDAISESLMQRVQVTITDDLTAPSQDWQIPRAEITYARGLDYLNKIIGERFGQAGSMEDVLVTRGEDRIILSLVADSMFAPGSAEIRPESQETLRQLGLFLGTIGNAVSVEGHTDPRPINNATYPSNWELSMARAMSVARAIRATGYPHMMDIYGHGSARHGELASLPAPQREALARRVDIVVRETVAKD